MTITIKYAEPRPVLYCELCGKEITRKHGRGWQSRLKDRHHFCCVKHKAIFYNNIEKRKFIDFYEHPAREWISKIYKKGGTEVKENVRIEIKSKSYN